LCGFRATQDSQNKKTLFAPLSKALYDPMMPRRKKTYIFMRLSCVYVLFIFLISFLNITALQANELAGNPSPYLALHGNDPVNWVAWSKSALSKAHKEGKLLFVSVGYFSCHWCHVMQRESFSNQGIAKVLNQHFIAIKVDRELNPVLDDRLMDFIQATRGRGGWPLNVFLTPDGYPLTAITYASADSFAKMLDALQSRWKNEHDELTKAAREVDQILSKQNGEAEALDVSHPIKPMMDAFVSQALQYADEIVGGFGHQNKFPNAPALWALLEINAQKKHVFVTKFLKLTLDKMADGGLYDQVGDGFFRYTVDPQWETPHFEKMLYTNAMLAILYLRAGDQFNNQHYKTIGLRTIRFMLDAMKAPEGAFIASLSAVDSHNIEGGFYLWQHEELKRLLSQEELRFVDIVWDMRRDAEFEAGLLPWVILSRKQQKERFKLTDAALNNHLDSIRTKLKKARAAERRLPQDNKRLAGWNGLVLAALAEGVLYDKRLQQPGNALMHFIQNRLWQENSLQKAVDNSGKSLGDGSLQDYAYVAYGLAQWGKLTKDRSANTLAKKIIEQAWQRFYTQKGWRESEHDLLPRPLFRRHIRDSSLVSAESLLLRASRMFPADKILQQRVDVQLTQRTISMNDDRFYYATLISTAAMQ
jgi:uncharacterized protein YyaL (SSP411 family)